ncbi:hypothetical protein BN874_890001 [Candidatus Contendobacter odensis Run_B_J11]|uniref:PRTase associated wHTH domain-containing protein n=1 Tax=Candidatus Contendobacter odensis Run_B_J11 TaxID=1400861 RepID=A0A7U7J6A6_9GAMM|nr:hypothetical protein BN874_890001 [Candidatus Contendobacter odensis Run_B_J11]
MIKLSFSRDRELLVDTEVQDGLERYFKKVGAEVVIFDNLSSLCNGIDENSSLDQEKYLVWFKKLRIKGLVVLYVDHKGKDARRTGPRGASKKEDWVSTSMDLIPYGKKAQADFTIKVTKCRGQRPSQEDIHVRLKPNVFPMEWEIMGKETVETELDLQVCLLQLLAEGKDLTQNQLAGHSNTSQSTVSRNLKTLIGDGYLNKNHQLTLKGKEFLKKKH